MNIVGAAVTTGQDGIWSSSQFESIFGNVKSVPDGEKTNLPTCLLTVQLVDKFVSLQVFSGGR